MSKQLSISAAFSIFAMAAFMLFAPSAPPANQTGTAVNTAVPAVEISLPRF